MPVRCRLRSAAEPRDNAVVRFGWTSLEGLSSSFVGRNCQRSAAARLLEPAALLIPEDVEGRCRPPPPACVQPWLRTGAQANLFCRRASHSTPASCACAGGCAVASCRTRCCASRGCERRAQGRPRVYFSVTWLPQQQWCGRRCCLENAFLTPVAQLSTHAAATRTTTPSWASRRAPPQPK